MSDFIIGLTWAIGATGLLSAAILIVMAVDEFRCPPPTGSESCGGLPEGGAGSSRLPFVVLKP